MTGVLPRRPSWLDDHLDEWVDAGIVDDAQREAIQAYERSRGPDAEGVPRRLSIGAEVAAYIGSVLALAGVVAAVGDSWEDWSFPARLGIALVLVVVGLGAGHWLFRFGEPGTDRVGGFVTTLGIGGVALTTGLIVDEAKDRADVWIPWSVGVAVLVVSLLIWRNRNRPMQLATAIVGFGVAGVATADLLDERFWMSGVVFLGSGLGLALLGHLEWAKPPLIAIVGGGVGAYLGSYLLADLNEHLGPSVALGVALLFVLYAVRTDLTLLLVLAIGGATIASFALLATTFESAISALGVALIGLALVGVVISRSVRRAPT